MIERGGRLRLLLEPAQTLRVRGETRREDLDRDISPEPVVPRPVDLSHPAGTERRDDLVRSDPGSRGKCHGGLRDYTFWLSRCWPRWMPARRVHPALSLRQE